MTEENVCESLAEVRRIKAACWREVAGLPIKEAVRKRLADSAATAHRLGFGVSEVVPGGVPRVAEAGVEYGGENKG